MKFSQPYTSPAEVETVMSLFDQVLQGPMKEKIPPVISNTMTIRPDLFEAVMAAGKPILFAGALPTSVKQMIVMTIASKRNCDYCTEVHKAMLEAMGIDQTLIDSCLSDPDMKLVPPMFRQILKFANDAALQPGDIGDDRFTSLRDSGLNEEEILEVAMVASFANFLVTWTDVPASLSE